MIKIPDLRGHYATVKHKDKDGEVRVKRYVISDTTKKSHVSRHHAKHVGTDIVSVRLHRNKELLAQAKEEKANAKLKAKPKKKLKESTMELNELNVPEGESKTRKVANRMVDKMKKYAGVTNKIERKPKLETPRETSAHTMDALHGENSDVKL